MNKLRPRNKICFQNNKTLHLNLKLYKLKKKKWNLFKKRTKHKRKKIEIKPEKKKKFFQKRLFEIQKFRNFYGCIPLYQLKKKLNKLKIKKNNNNFFNKFIFSLESRLDINIVRLKFAKSIFHAKQLINHNKVKINNKIINKSGFILKKGDVINLV